MSKQQLLAAILAIAQITALTPIPIYSESAGSIIREAPASAAKLIQAAEGGEVALGEAKVVIPPGALGQDTEIRITRLSAVAETGESLLNATQGGGGYRFEPAGTRFAVEARIELPYDRRLEGKAGSLEELRSYYYDTETRQWEGLDKRGLDEARGVVASGTTHFTDMINGTLSAPESAGPIDVNLNSIKGLEAADPSAGVSKLEFQGGTSDGSAGFRLGIAAPEGRNGMTPRVAITYNSGDGAGIAGKGFDVQYGSQIAVDTRYGAARYDGSDRYVLDGTMLEIRTGSDGPSGTSIVEYRPLREMAYSLIEHIRDGNYWEVTEKDGLKKTYGQSGNSWGGKSAAEKNLWSLEREEDTYGNTIVYAYEKADGYVYLQAITYTGYQQTAGLYRIGFVYEEDRPDTRIDGRGGYIQKLGRRIAKIEVYGAGIYLRGYEFKYNPDTSENANISMVTDLVGYDENRNEAYRYSFEYEEIGKVSGKPQYFGEPIAWGDGVLQATQGMTTGTQYSGGASLGVGEPTGNFDLRGGGGKQHANGTGENYSEYVLADINGDGLADSVRQEGAALSIRLNTGNGFAAPSYRSLPGFDAFDLEKEENSNESNGWSVLAGVGTPAGVVGPSKAVSKQTGKSALTSSFMDMDGDGLTDVAVSNSNIYYKNMTSGDDIENVWFEPRSISIAGGMTNYQPELSEEQKQAYHEAYYIQRPFRMWKAPYEGTVRISQAIQKLAGAGQITADTHRSAGRIAEASITIRGIGGGQSETVMPVNNQDRLYFIHDTVGAEANRRDIQGNDITWNIKATYVTIRPFRNTDELIRYTPQPEVSAISDGRLSSLYVWHTPPGQASRYRLVSNYRSIVSNSANTDVRTALYERGDFIPFVIAKDRFEYIMSYKSLKDAKTLASHYVYNAGRQEYRGIDWLETGLAYQEAEVRKALELGEKKAILHDLAEGKIWPDFEDEAVVYKMSDTREVGKVRSRSEEGSVYNGGGRIVLGVYMDETATARLENNSWKFYKNETPTSYPVEHKNIDNGIQITVTALDDFGKEEGKVIWQLTEAETKAQTIEYDEMRRVWKDGYSYHAESERYHVEKHYWEKNEVEEAKNFFTQYIADEIITQNEADTFFAECFNQNIIYERDENGEPTSEVDYYEYERKTPLNPDARNRAEQLLERIGWHDFLTQVFSYYDYVDGAFRLQEVYKETDDYDDALKKAGRDFQLIKYQKIKKEIHYNNEYVYTVVDDWYQHLSLDESHAITRENTATLLSWNSNNQYVTGNETAAKEFYYQDGDYRVAVVVENDDILYGGTFNWHYGIWIGDEQLNPFSEDRLNSQRSAAQDKMEMSESEAEQYANVTEPAEVDDAQEAPDDNNVAQRRHYQTQNLSTVRELYQEETPEKEYEMNQSLDSLLLMGEISVTAKQTTGWAGNVRAVKTEKAYYFPYFYKDFIHTNRSGGTSYYTIPGMTTAASANRLGSIRESKSYGTDESRIFSAAYFSGNKSQNDTTGEMTQTMQDLNGDGIPDILQSGGKARYGRLEGTTISYGGETPLPGIGVLSKNISSTSTLGGGLSASGNIPALSSSGKIKGLITNTSAGLDGSMSQSTGTTRQEIGLFDINGDGLADYFDQGAIQLGLGYEFKPNAMLNTPDAKSRGKTKGENHTVGAGSGSNLGNAAETRTFMAGLSAGISDGATAAYNTQMFLDLNGDGLPDAVRKNDVSLIERYNMQYSVQYNTGNGFLPSQEIYMPGWGNFTGKTAQDRYENNSDGELPLALETIPLVGKLFTNYRKSFNYSPYSNPYGDDELAELAENLDFNSTVTKGINGGINAGGTLKIKIGIFGLAISLNIGANGNAGANGSVSLTGVTARMLDINGDGFVDQVLRIPGMGTYAKLNLGAKVGLLKKITLPQGGTYELRYDERMGNTAAMPQSRYVLTSMTMNDNETERGGVHSYTTRYTYRDGYYDRIKKEFYGFSTVTTTYADQSHKVVEYHNRDYYAKGMEKTQAVYNSSGKPLRSSFSALDMAPYARVVETRSYSHDETSDDYVRTRITYAYDAYGNVSVLTDYGDESSVADIIIAEITYWIGGAAKYLHSHPVRIAVSSPSTGAVLRIREGTYNDNGSLVTLRQYYESGKEPLQQTYRYNQYGNLEETRDSVGVTVQYEYDGAARQYITKISQTRASGGESYASALEWDAARGHKLRETDPNGNSMAYRYDQRSRLTEIRSSYDTGSVPAVSYEYNTEAGTKWSATTRNKIVFDGNDHAVMLTVLELDGLGRPRRTAKAGEVYNPATRQTQQGWNVSGSVAYDGKGRTTQEGQTYFVPGAVVSLFLASPLAMLRETTKAYDSLDRVVKETLPDGSVQKTRYGITAEGQDRYAYTQTTDPLGNQTRQLRDERENIVRVERLDAQGKLLTKAAYWYNALGEMVLAKDAAGNPLQVAYDMLGRRTSLESYDSGRTDYTYNAKGQLWQESNGELRRQGKRIDYGYDSFGRLIKIDYPVSVDVIYEYGGPGAAAANLAGRLVRVSDESGEIRYEYGKLGEVVKERRAILQRTDGLGRSREAIMEYRSDYLGRMQAITYPDGETVRYGYDYGGNVVSVAGTKQGQAFPYVEKIGYDEWGQRVYLKLGNGVETTYTYNEDRRWLSRVLTESAGQAGKSVLQNIQYDFDMTGNVLSYANTAGTYSTSQEYAYDGLYQLVYAKGVSVNKPHGDFDYKAEYTQTYQFDALGLGNMTEKRSWTANTDPRRLGDPLDYEQDYAYAAGYAHRAERIGRRHYRYDLNGNVATEQDGPFSAVVSTGGHTITELENGTKVVDNGWGMNDNGLTVPAPKVWKREYAWNERNLLRTSRDDQHIVEYTYGQDGERSGKYSMTADGGHRHETLYFNKMWTWHYDGLLNEFTGRNSKHVYLGESRIVTKISHADGGSTAEERIKQYYYHSDHLGSAQVISNADGQEYERIEYTPYGELWIEKASAASNIDIPYRFTGKERDEETGLYYYGARYLDSKASRWLSTDPALGEYIPGAPVDNEARKQNQSLPGIGGVFNTVNLHLYHYAGNNPVKYVDPDGKDLHISVSRSQGTLTATYTPNEIYDDQYTEYLSKTTTTTSYNVITNVVKNNPNNNSSYDTSRTQRSEGGITNPTQLKNGTYQLTDSRAPSNSVNPSPKYKYGEPGEGIFINVIQMLPDVETGELVSDSGYMIHITPNAFTDGCIGIPYDPNEGSLSKSGAQNKMDRLVDWYNIATRRGENASISIVD